MEKEIRSLVEAPQISNDGNTLEGFAAVYNSPSQDLGGFTEIIRPGAFDRALASGNDVVARFNHHPDSILGRTSNNTLRLWSDSRGLRYSVKLDDTTDAVDLKKKIKRGDISGSSFEFRTAPKGDSWRKDNGKVIRELRDVDIFDVGPVINPAYKATSTSVRSIEELNKQEQEEAAKVVTEQKAQEEKLAAEQLSTYVETLKLKQKQFEIEASI